MSKDIYIFVLVSTASHIDPFPFSRQGFDRLYKAYRSSQREIKALQADGEEKTARILQYTNRQKRMKTKMEELQSQNQLLHKDIEKEREKNKAAGCQLAAMKQKANKDIAKLKEELRIAKTPVNSSNSSKPPSMDMYKPPRNTSLRTRSGKRTGGQKGHLGTTLPFNATSTPDVTVPLRPDRCERCGGDLSLINEEQFEVRQKVDIPKPEPVITNYVQYGKTCGCGHCSKGTFPKNVNGLVSYGAHLETLVANLHARQYIPYQRTVTLIDDLFGIHISEGTVANMLARFSKKAMPTYCTIQNGIFSSEYVGADETGSKVDGKKGWFHTYQNDQLTFIGYHPSRGNDARDFFFPEGLPHSILGTDCLAMQLGTSAKKHQVCLTAHIGRELKAMIEEHPDQKWPQQMKELFKEAVNLRDKDHVWMDVQEIEKRFEVLIAIDQKEAPGKISAFWKRMVKHSDKIFTFLYFSFVPTHNNGSEKAIRNVKVKTKVSGQFKSAEGAQQYAVIRSVIDTATKQDEDVHEKLASIARLTPD